MSEHTTTPAMPLDDRYEFEDEAEIPPRPRRRLVTPLTGALSAVVVAGLGFIGGVQVQKHHAGSPTASAATGARAGFAARFGGGGGGAGGAGAGGGAAPTVGTVSSTHGSVLYVKDSSGTVIRVRTTAGSKVTRTATSGASHVHPGDSVVVTGTTAKNGTITASRVSATQAGAAPAGGFPGGGFAGGAGSSR
jgi:hypothetical protein